MSKLKLSKATDNDFDLTSDFLSACSQLFDSRHFRSFEEDWKHWDDQDDDKIKITQLQKLLAEEENCEPNEVDNRLILYEFIKWKYKKCDCHWGRVIMAASVLIDSVCNPQCDTVELHPHIARALENTILGE